jgi:hypothetical protein
MSTHDAGGEELPPEIRSALATLPREAEPGRLLEERTVRALREAGVIAAPAARPRRFRAGWLGGAVAAGIALFVSGVAAGQWMGARESRALVEAVRAEDSRAATLAVQRTGSAYVQALARLAASGDSAGAAADPQGREVAAAMLRAAADELLRIAPDDPVAAAVLSAYQRDSVPASSAAGKQRVVWF